VIRTSRSRICRYRLVGGLRWLMRDLRRRRWQERSGNLDVARLGKLSASLLTMVGVESGWKIKIRVS